MNVRVTLLHACLRWGFRSQVVEGLEQGALAEKARTLLPEAAVGRRCPWFRARCVAATPVRFPVAGTRGVRGWCGL